MLLSSGVQVQVRVQESPDVYTRSRKEKAQKKIGTSLDGWSVQNVEWELHSKLCKQTTRIADKTGDKVYCNGESITKKKHIHKWGIRWKKGKWKRRQTRTVRQVRRQPQRLQKPTGHTKLTVWLEPSFLTSIVLFLFVVATFRVISRPFCSLSPVFDTSWSVEWKRSTIYCSDGKYKEWKRLTVSKCNVKTWVEAKERERANCTFSGLNCCLLFISKSKIEIQEDTMKQK